MGIISHITRAAANKIGADERIRKHPILIFGFGNSQSKPVTKFTSLMSVGVRNKKEKIDFNTIESEISSNLPGVIVHIFKEFPHLLKPRKELSSSIPKPDTVEYAVIGVKDKSKLAVKHVRSPGSLPSYYGNLCIMRNVDFTKTAFQIQTAIFTTTNHLVFS